MLKYDCALLLLLKSHMFNTVNLINKLTEHFDFNIHMSTDGDINDYFTTLMCFPFRPITKASSTSQSTSWKLSHDNMKIWITFVPFNIEF